MRPSCIVALVLATFVSQGCYKYAPLQTDTPPVGQTVQMNISDRGRLELAERLGRGVSMIRARVLGIEGDQFLLGVSSVAYLGGAQSTWSGETMRLNRDFVEQTQLRTLDKRRTWIAAGVATVVVVSFMASRGLLTGFGIGSDPPDPPDPPPSFTPRFRIQF